MDVKEELKYFLKFKKKNYSFFFWGGGGGGSGRVGGSGWGVRVDVNREVKFGGGRGGR